MSSVKNFSPHLLDVFRLVSEKGEFQMKCSSNKEALAIRARLYNLRKAMREENHWLLPVAEACHVAARDNMLLAYRPDKPIEEKLEKALKEQGFKERMLPR